MKEIGARHGKRLKISEIRLLDRFGRPLEKTDVCRSSDVAFLLFPAGTASDQSYGALFKYVDERGGVGFLWFKTARVIGELWRLWRVYEPEVRGVLLGPREVPGAIAREEPSDPIHHGSSLHVRDEGR